MSNRSSLSKRNQRGVWVLLIILFIVVISPRILQLTKNESSWTLTEHELEVSMNSIDENVKFQKKKYSTKFSKSSKYKVPPKSFDPNLYSLNDWVKLGVSEKQANVILKFTKRGIYSNEELKQIFVLPEKLYELLKDSTFYPERKVNFKSGDDQKYIKPVFEIVNINTASQTELEKLNGIGPFYAKKIIEYRTQLGGFINKDQLLEIWKFDAEKFDKIKNDIEISSSSSIVKLNINTATAEELKAHPYISWNVANSIVKMRNKFQKYSNFEQLLESELIDKELLKKIQPYLTL